MCACACDYGRRAAVATATAHLIPVVNGSGLPRRKEGERLYDIDFARANQRARSAEAYCDRRSGSGRPPRERKSCLLYSFSATPPSLSLSRGNVAIFNRRHHHDIPPPAPSCFVLARTLQRRLPRLRSQGKTACQLIFSAITRPQAAAAALANPAHCLGPNRLADSVGQVGPSRAG